MFVHPVAAGAGGRAAAQPTRVPGGPHLDSSIFFPFQTFCRNFSHFSLCLPSHPTSLFSKPVSVLCWGTVLGADLKGEDGALFLLGLPPAWWVQVGKEAVVQDSGQSTSLG